jgi:LCP family protein required for cell wall assembly
MDALAGGLVVQRGVGRRSRRERPRRIPTRGGAALRSALVPGWGQFAAGSRMRGLLLTSGALLILASVALGALAVVRPFLPSLPGPIDPLVVLVGDLPLRILELTLAADWVVIWRGLIALNLVLLAIRVLVSADAANCAQRAWRAAQAAAQAGWASGSPDGVAAGRPLLPPAPRGAVATFVTLFALVAPHVGVFGAGIALKPLVDRVLVTSAPAPPAIPAPAATNTEAQVIPDTNPVPGRPIWDGQSRLNVLLMGTDRRPQETATSPRGNSDTLLVVSIDPVTRSAAIISIPRDVYLPIPSVGPEKINAAYREGGPDLSVRVVSDLINQPIHRWASIDITAFSRVVDAVGGVVVDVERPIRDDEYPTEDYSVRRVYIPSGLQWLTGEQALWFARSRHGSNDFDRASRQQALLLSLKDRARDRRVLPRIPTLIQSLADAAQTDVAPREVLALIRMGGTSDFRSARLVLTPPNFGREIILPNLYAIEPNLPRIRVAVAETFAGTSRDVGVASAGTPAQGGAGGPFLPEDVTDDVAMDGFDVP